MATINVGGRTVEVPDNLDPRSAPSATPRSPLRTAVTRPAPGPRMLSADEAARTNPQAAAAYGERVNPTLRPNQAAFHGDGRYGAPASFSDGTSTSIKPASGLRAAASRFTAPTAPAASAAGRATQFAGRALGLAGGVVAEGAPILDVARNAGSTKTDVATQVAEGATRLATAGLGAKAGAMGGAAIGSAVPVVGTAVGGILGGLAGGAAGYFGGDSAIKGLRSAFGVTEASPVDRMPQRSPNPSGAPSAAPSSAPAPLVQGAGPATPAGPTQNDITRAVGPDGRVSYSGGNVGADARIFNTNGSLRTPNVSVMPGAPTPTAAPAVPVNDSAPTVLNSTNSWQARNDLRSAMVSANSNTASDAQKAAYGAQLAADLKLRGMQPELDAEMRKSGNSLRGQMNDASQRLAGDQYRADQNLRGQIFDASTTAATARAKSASDAAKNAQTFGESASKSAVARLESLAATPDGKIDPARLAQARAAANSIVPGFESMTEQEQAAAMPQVLAAVRAVQGMNDLRDPTLLNAVGLDSDSPAINTLPNMQGARVGEVGLFEGLRTPKVSSGDYRISMPDGTVRHLPRATTDQNTLELLKRQGAILSN